MKNLTTYQTIQEAFRNGTGDVFFKKENQFVCFSRHDNNIEEMESEGFEFINYEEVIRLSNQDNTTTSAAIWCVSKKQIERQSNMVKSHDNICNGRDGYYDEFPDALNQYL